MDSLTQMIKNEIKRQYKTVAQFSRESGIPYATVSNALSKGIGTTAYDTVVKMCTLLGIKQAYDSDIVLFNRQFHDIYTKLTELDEKGVHTIVALLNMEYNRCKEEEKEGHVKGYNGIGYAPRQAFDEAHVMSLVRRVKQHESDASEGRGGDSPSI